MSAEELRKIQEILQARTRYETETPRKMYIYTKQQHDTKIIKLREQEIELHNKNKELKNKMWYYGWKIKKTTQKKPAKTKKKRSKILQRSKKNSRRNNGFKRVKIQKQTRIPQNNGQNTVHRRTKKTNKRTKSAKQPNNHTNKP